MEETFQILRRYGVKLNPQKCLFGAKGGRFLGYIVTERDIEANPSEINALQDMPPPRNLREGERMHLSVQLDYRATNNEAEYEALIAGLQAARHVGASRVVIHTDSQLAAQQLMGAFEINNARLKLYAEAFEKLKTNFTEVMVQKIPRAENQATDE
ncbi:uncharacterized protein Mb2253c-like [Zingiber officinale]|uniref:uncharacterized protein Mb2253c-like n=1 Tax=Zingiber officinale TaxID=94328 RepID=UPI001C4C7094|nr:uncharacterized protein Mb2253c-like [Zingiber officinale]